MPSDDDLVTLSEAARVLGRRRETVGQLRKVLAERGRQPGQGSVSYPLYRLGDVREALAKLPGKKGYAAFANWRNKRAG